MNTRNNKKNKKIKKKHKNKLLLNKLLEILLLLYVRKTALVFHSALHRERIPYSLLSLVSASFVAYFQEHCDFTICMLCIGG